MAGGGVVGPGMLLKVGVVSEKGSVALPGVAPLSVLPGFQRKGIGGRLLLEAHRRAAEAGYRGALLLGHKDYYPRFGYRRASLFGIRFPFDAPDECCMAVEFRPGSLDGVHGEVRYPSVFFE